MEHRRSVPFFDSWEVSAPKSHGSHMQMKMLATATKQAFSYKDGEQVFYFVNAGAQLARAASLQGASCSR